MSEVNIGNMDLKQLRNEVQELRDELARMKRLYEDTLYNLDYDNFSPQLIKEKDGMKAEIELTAEGLSSKVSKDDFAEYSEISQTARAISTIVSRNVNLSEAVRVNNMSDMTDTSKIYYTQGSLGKTYYYHNGNVWLPFKGDTIYTLFKQTANGFELKGDTTVDGNQIVLGNLILGGNITWDLSNSPVQTRYSVSGNANNNNDWHPSYTEGDLFMQMSFDGGSTWSTPTKIVGTDGEDGSDGNDADVTPENVFDALTESGARQGIFAIFDKKVGEQGSEQLFINAEYIQGNIIRGKTIQSLMSNESDDCGEYVELNREGGKISFFYKPLNKNAQERVKIFQSAGATYIKNFNSTLHIGCAEKDFEKVQGNTCTVYPEGTWDFSHCDEIAGLNVSGVTAVFG